MDMIVNLVIRTISLAEQHQSYSLPTDRISIPNPPPPPSSLNLVLSITSDVEDHTSLDFTLSQVIKNFVDVIQRFRLH